MINLWPAGKHPRVHGNGFVQLDLTPNTRLHVWGDERIPKQASPTPIHDHVFGFTSRVILGTIGNLRYDVGTPGPVRSMYDAYTYDVHKAVVHDREDTALVPTGEVVGLQNYPIHWYGTGETYSMRPGDLHETVVHELTVTVIEKTPPAPGQSTQPRIFVPYGRQPDNEFRRYNFEPDLLWQIVADALLKARITLRIP